MSERRRIEVSAGVVERDGQILIAQRRPGDHLGLYWEFPGGKREAAESWEDCLRRELLEELGVEVIVGAWLDAVTHEYEDRDVQLRFFRCRIAHGTPASLDCHDIRWVEPRALAHFQFPEADAELVRRLAARGPARRDPARVTIQRRVGASAPVALDVPWGTHLSEVFACRAIRSWPGCAIGQCGACAVDVVAGAANLTAPTPKERAFLAADSRRGTRSDDPQAPRRASRPRRRLACQARVTGDVSVVLEERALLHF